MLYTLPMRNSSRKGISTFGSGAPLSKRTSVQDVAWLEKTEKLMPPGTDVAPNGNGLPARSL